MAKTRSPTLRHTVVITSKEDLGTRADSVRRLGRRMDRERVARALTWVGDPAATEAKRREVIARLAYNPPAVPLRPRLLREEQTPAGTRRIYRLRINPDDDTEAVLMLPRGASRRNPAPALLGLHEHGGMFLLGKEKLFGGLATARPFTSYQRRCYGDQPPGDYFARQGFAVLCFDQIGFGSRALCHRTDRRRLSDAKLSARAELNMRLRMRYEHLWLHRALLAYGVTEADVAIHDSRRALDFLQGLPEVDGNRIGAFGLSVGAMHTHFLAALDRRVRASVRVCWTGEHTAMLGADGPRGLGVHFLVPGLTTELHPAEWTALSAPAPVLILNGREDPLYPRSAQERERRRVIAYARREPNPRRVTWSYFDGGHAFLPAQQRETLGFFRRHLSGSLLHRHDDAPHDHVLREEEDHQRGNRRDQERREDTR